jgi:hypothetical protein
MWCLRFVLAVVLAGAGSASASAAVLPDLGVVRVGASPGAAITGADFLTPAQIRARLDLARPLSAYALDPVDETPEPDPDCATNRPAATSSKVYPAARSRTQTFEYQVPGAAWTLQGRVLVLEYASRAKARAAFERAADSVRAYTRYTLVCEAINPIITGQATTNQADVPGRSLTWRYRLRATHAGSWRDVLATSGRRVVWVELGREYRADLDWDAGRPAADFPKYPSLGYLEQLAQGAVARGL